jgi:hypothetical protein
MESKDEEYISASKKNIDNFIHERDYRKAFALLILVLEKLNDKQKVELVDYYSKNLQKCLYGHMLS